MSKPNVVQLNNQYINDENLKKRYEAEELRRKKSFNGLGSYFCHAFIYFTHL
ncbi:Cell division protein DivIC (FtsB), stabilizes FtsL against RasP cleavage [Streptococcus agalactiae]|nr:Cell division protein DivIC (FtsB), stabilizes FtsL against RasP cleavage [Streptococcus agalactiae]